MKKKPRKLDVFVVFAIAWVVPVASAQDRPINPLGPGEQVADVPASHAGISTEGIDAQPGVFGPGGDHGEFAPLSHNLEARRPRMFRKDSA